MTLRGARARPRASAPAYAAGMLARKDELGNRAAFCAGCGWGRRFLAGRAGRAARRAVPTAAQAVIAACPSCGEGITSLMQITCSGCGEALRERRVLRPADPPQARAPRRDRRRAVVRRRGRRGLRLRVARSPLLGVRRPDLGEVDHGDRVLVRDLAVVELPEEDDELVERAQLGVVVLQLARRDVAEALDLDLVDDRVEDVRARAEALAARAPSGRGPCGTWRSCRRGGS